MFTSVADLTDAITTWAEHWNTNPKPFIWKATAEDIITKVRRGRDNPPPDQITDGPLASIIRDLRLSCWSGGFYRVWSMDEAGLAW